MKNKSKTAKNQQTNLYSPGNPRGVHPAGRVDRVAPDVVQPLRVADHARGNFPVVETDPEHQLEVEQGLVEQVQAVLVWIIDLMFSIFNIFY